MGILIELGHSKKHVKDFLFNYSVEGIYDEVAKLQVVTLDDNCKEHDILQFDIHDRRQGIVHVVGPEQGLTLPGIGRSRPSNRSCHVRLR